MTKKPRTISVPAEMLSTIKAQLHVIDTATKHLRHILEDGVVAKHGQQIVLQTILLEAVLTGADIALDQLEDHENQ